MNIEFWIAVTALLGVASIGVCYLFLLACEKI
jgi:hypothetical protein